MKDTTIKIIHCLLRRSRLISPIFLVGFTHSIALAYLMPSSLDNPPGPSPKTIDDGLFAFVIYTVTGNISLYGCVMAICFCIYAVATVTRSKRSGKQP